MPQLGTNTERSFFRAFAQGWNSVAQSMEDELRQYFNEQVALGRDPQDVIAELKKEDNAIIKRITGRVALRIDEGGNVLFQIASNDPLKDVAEMFVWTLDPAAEHCDSCLAQSRMGPRTWDEMPYPTQQPTVGKTNCGNYCRCTLEPEVANS